MASPAKQTAKQKRNLPKVIVDAIAKKKGKGRGHKPQNNIDCEDESLE